MGKKVLNKKIFWLTDISLVQNQLGQNENLCHKIIVSELKSSVSRAQTLVITIIIPIMMVYGLGPSRVPNAVRAKYPKLAHGGHERGI